MCQNVKKMSSYQKDVQCQKVKHEDYGGGSQKINHVSKYRGMGHMGNGHRGQCGTGGIGYGGMGHMVNRAHG